MKEFQFSPTIGDHDYQVKLKKMKSLLEKSKQVKTVIISRGRQLAHLEIAEQLMTRVIVDLGDFGQITTGPKILGNRMSVAFNPKKK